MAALGALDLACPGHDDRGSEAPPLTLQEFAKFLAYSRNVDLIADSPQGGSQYPTAPPPKGGLESLP